ncbi:hypothetical protein P8452_71073 [Trifolium repens]|nr:hypothetical protein P8452_71073 [Trifolium repens]
MYHDLKENYWWPNMKAEIAEFVSRCIKGQDSIWVIVDRLTKSAHFIPVKSTYKAPQYAAIFMEQIVRLHGVPLSIVSDRDPIFTSRFWKAFQNAMGTRLKMSTSHHPQTDGQSERTIQTLEDMLRACVLEDGGSWSNHLHLIEFAYNNSYHASIGMAPYEALYGRKCRTSLCWTEVGDRSFLGPDIVQETTLKIKGLFGKLRKYIPDPYQPVELEQIDLQPDLTYQSDPVRIVERDAKILRNKRIPIVKVEWAQSPDGEFTWELESDMRKNYPYLFSR